MSLKTLHVQFKVCLLTRSVLVELLALLAAGDEHQRLEGHLVLGNEMSLGDGSILVLGESCRTRRTPNLQS